MYLAVHLQSGQLYFTPHYYQEPLPAFKFLLLPQAWTLGIELLFYAVAPFLVRRSVPFLLGGIAASVGLRAVLYTNGFHNDPWTYRFFPNELAFFLVGALGYKFYRSLRDRETFNPNVGKAAFGIAVGFILLYTFLPLPGERLLFYLYMGAAIPLIFRLTQKHRWDRKLGELSYPMYISHLLIVHILATRHWNTGILTVLLTVIVSVLLLEFVDEPMDRFRQRRIAQQQSQIKKGGETSRAEIGSLGR
jgi:peptidoglycan/LPS O-acetylase OafA/YrhL